MGVDDLELIGRVEAGLRDFADRHVLAPCPDADELRAWLATTVRGRRPNSYVVAVDGGEVVAGVGVQDETVVGVRRVTHMPPHLRVATRLLRVVPPDGILRTHSTRLSCFRPGRGDAARALLAHLRDEPAGSTVVVEADPSGPGAAALRLPAWRPSTALDVMVREPAGLRLADGPLGVVP